MVRYLLAAFAARPRIPSLGAVPLNILGVAGFAILGAASPAFWLLGLGLETAYLFGLASSRRFRDSVDRRGAPSPPPRRTGPRSWNELAETLGEDARRRINSLHGKLRRIDSLYSRFVPDDSTAEQNRRSLQLLLEHYGKLLAVRESIDLQWTDDGGDLEGELRELEREIRAGGLPEDLRTSKMRTVEILQARVENQKRRTLMREELESEMRRIEAQFDLTLENAAMSGKPEAVTLDLAIDLARIDAAITSHSRWQGSQAAPAETPRRRSRERA